MKIAVAGLGYVGMANAVLLAQYNSVVAIDIDAERVAMVNHGHTTIVDPLIAQYLALSLIHISEPTRLSLVSRMPSSA